MHKTQVNKQELKKKYGDEQVFVAPTSMLSHIANGFTRENHDKSIFSRYDNLGKFIYRYDAEGDATFQQIIPYIVVYNPITKLFYAYERIKGAGEARLHNQLSLGFGGHIDITDGTQEVVFKGLVRELMEELDYNNLRAVEFIGHIRDMNSTTNDHTGLVFVLPVDHAEVRETEKYQGRWMTAQELEDNYFKFENWGKYLIDYLVANKLTAFTKET